MAQTVIAIFESSNAAQSARENLIDQGIGKSALKLTAKQGGENGQSMKAIRSFLGELFGPDEADEAENYVEAIDRGGILLSVDVANDADLDTVRETLDQAGPMDLEERSQQWRQEKSARSGAKHKPAQQERQSVPVVQEELDIGKQQVGQGKVRVTSKMVETPVREEVELKAERATVERRPVDRPISPDEVEAMGEEASIEIEETTERPVVSKQARVVEEVEVGKETSESTETIEDTVRHTEVKVEHEPSEAKKQEGGRGGKEKGRKR